VRAAFFDLDHTLIIGRSTERIFVRRLLREGELSARQIIRYLAQFAREPRLTGGYFRRNKMYLAGKSLARIREVAGAAAAEALKQLSPRGRQRLEEHHQAGRLTVLITGTLDILAEPLSRTLPIDVVLATRMGTEDSHLTGEVLGLYPRGENKRVLMEELAASRGLELGESFAYGDDWHDLPMLEAVGHPVAVNPCRSLKRVALERGWPIEEF
jgi:HAD superfamily hydrolase (TIGR01490 family)